MPLRKIFNAAMPTTGPMVQVDTTAILRTMLQIKCDHKVIIVEWGASMNAATAAEGPQFELLTTGTVFGTVTAHGETGVSKYNDPDGVASSTLGFTLSTTGTGFDASAEGSITITQVFDAQIIQPTGLFVIQFPLGREPVANHDDALRIRVKAPVAVNCLCYVLIEV